MTEAEWAWLAGLLEGEACFTPSGSGSSGKKQYPRITLAMTDEDVVRRVYELTGVGLLWKVDRWKKKESYKTLFYWRVHTKAHIEFILNGILPWMGERRTQKILEELARSSEVLTAHRDKTHCPQGHEYNAVNTYHSPQGGRSCRVCKRERRRVKR